MLRRILILWLIANFSIIGAVSWLAGGWYLGWSSLIAVLTEVGLIALPNFILPVLALKYWWTEPVREVRQALGWSWNGWRAVLA